MVTYSLSNLLTHSLTRSLAHSLTHSLAHTYLLTHSLTYLLTYSGPAADKGWLVHPAENRLVMFNASLLHGVIPGKGINPDINQRRLTFMIGFWRDIAATQRGLDHAGPAQYFPDIEKTKYNWPKIMKLSEFPKSADTGSEKVIPQDISAVWEPIDIDERVGANLLVKGHNVPYSLIWQGF